LAGLPGFICAIRRPNSDSAGIGCGKSILIPREDFAPLCKDADNGWTPT